MTTVTTGLALLPLDVLAHPVGGWNGGGPGWLFLLVPLVWLVVLVALFAVLGRRWRRGGAPWAAAHQAAPGAAAEGVLAQRFANGDVDEAEYRARLEVLRATRAPGF